MSSTSIEDAAGAARCAVVEVMPDAVASDTRAALNELLVQVRLDGLPDGRA